MNKSTFPKKITFAKKIFGAQEHMLGSAELDSSSLIRMIIKTQEYEKHRINDMAIQTPQDLSLFDCITGKTNKL